MPRLRDLFNVDHLETMLQDGFVRQQTHPNGRFGVFNYTSKAVYSRQWDEVTRQCRGLIVKLGTEEVMARPFPKFFNVGELTDDEIPAEPFRVFEKYDGSLGVLYKASENNYCIATRGSFSSEQALWATEWYKSHVSPQFEPAHGRTYLFEILYPRNRIVVDYAGREDLVLLDVIDNDTGESQLDKENARWHGWRGSVVAEYDGFDALASLLAAEQPLNSEGYVIRFKGGMRLKVKFDEYVRLHRIVTGVSTKTVWEYLSEGKDFAELLDRVPDEFYDWIKETRRKLQSDFDMWTVSFDRDYGFARPFAVGADARERKKNFAVHIATWPHKHFLFSLYEDKDIRADIWKMLQPTYEKPFVTHPEDVA